MLLVPALMDVLLTSTLNLSLAQDSRPDVAQIMLKSQEETAQLDKELQ